MADEATQQQPVKADEATQQQPVQVAKAVLKPSRGTCRICFEDDGDLIAPCLCSGTSKWIHRSCLNRWRITGSNPSSLTNCCECKFQYELELRRICDLRSEEVRRQFTRQVLSHSFLWFLGVQLIILALGVIVKLIDTSDMCVKWFGLEKFAKIYGLFPQLQHYALTYYVAGLLAFLLLTGFLIIGVFCCGLTPPMRECGVCVEGCELFCLACNPWTLCRCADLPALGLAECFQVCLVSAPESLLIIGLLITVAILLVGFLALLATLVLIVQRVFQRYVRLQEMGLLAEEYYVKDLATPQPEDQLAVVQQNMEQGSAVPQQQLSEDSQEEIQKLIAEELQAIFGSALPRADVDTLRQRDVPGYGSTGNTTDYRGG